MGPQVQFGTGHALDLRSISFLPGGTGQFPKARLADLGGVALAGSPAEFGKLIADETEKWAKVIKFAGIKPQ